MHKMNSGSWDKIQLSLPGKVTASYRLTSCTRSWLTLTRARCSEQVATAHKCDILLTHRCLIWNAGCSLEVTVLIVVFMNLCEKFTTLSSIKGSVPEFNFYCFNFLLWDNQKVVFLEGFLFFYFYFFAFLELIMLFCNIWFVILKGV